MTKRGIINLIFILSLVILAVFYILMGFYYNGSFSYGTWINHVYCTGKSVDEVNRELKDRTYYSGLLVKAKDGKSLFIDSSSVDFTVDYANELNDIIISQNPFAWGLAIFSGRDRTIKGQVSINKEKLNNYLSKWDIFERNQGDNYEIRRDDMGYCLIDNTKDIPIFDAFCHGVEIAFLNSEYSIDLSNEEGCYEKQKITEGDLAVKALYEKVEDTQSQIINFSIIDDGFSVSSKEISEWIVTIDDINTVLNEKKQKDNPGSGLFIYGGQINSFPEDYMIYGNFMTDKEGNLILSCKEIYSFLEKQADTFSTEKAILDFQNGENIRIPVSGSKDGIIFDKKTEYDFLVSALCSGEDCSREAITPKNSFTVNSSELGDEYILINMGEQNLSYYKNGSLKLTYDVVTGNTGRGRGTPVGFYHIYNKRYHTILRGADYASFVNYWLGVHKGIGIHDATWRNKFGGEIYKTSGSHGCINSPLQDMEELYNMVEVGVPVLLFY